MDGGLVQVEALEMEGTVLKVTTTGMAEGFDLEHDSNENLYFTQETKLNSKHSKIQESQLNLRTFNVQISHNISNGFQIQQNLFMYFFIQQIFIEAY